MKMEYDRTVHEKTIELEEFRLASEEIIEGLTNQLKDVSKDQDQLKMKNEVYTVPRIFFSDPSAIVHNDSHAQSDIIIHWFN